MFLFNPDGLFLPEESNHIFHNIDSNMNECINSVDESIKKYQSNFMSIISGCS